MPRDFKLAWSRASGAVFIDYTSLDAAGNYIHISLQDGVPRVGETNLKAATVERVYLALLAADYRSMPAEILSNIADSETIEMVVTSGGDNVRLYAEETSPPAALEQLAGDIRSLLGDEISNLRTRTMRESELSQALSVFRL